jgi:hypothetical protein
MKTPKLYVANGNNSHAVLQYRCPKTNQLRSLRIGAGRQEEISGKYTTDEIHQIVRQLEQYHTEVARVEDLRSSTNPRGMIFCLDKQFTSDVIAEGIEKSKEIAQEIASSEAENAGLAAFSAAKSVVGDVRETTLEVIQQDERGNTVRNSAIDFSYQVSKKAAGRQASARRGA